jgi:hypothetical protein
MNFKITSEEEAQFIIERDLTKAMHSLKAKGIERNDKILLDEFVEIMQATLTGHFRNIREICEGTASREAELLKWLNEVKRMIDALVDYKGQIEDDAFKRFSNYVDRVEKEVIPYIRTMLKPSNN